MDKSINWRIGLIIFIVGLSIFMFYPPGEKIKLGLDLRGGTHLVLEVQTDEAMVVQTDQVVAQLKSTLTESSIKFDKVIRSGLSKIEIIGTSFEDERKIKDILDDDYQIWNYTQSGISYLMVLKSNVEMTLREQTVNQAIEKIRNRIDEKGLADVKVQKVEGFATAGDKILVELPGVDDPTRVRQLIKSTAMLEWKEVVAGVFQTEEEALQKYNGQLPEDLELLKANPRTNSRSGFFVVKAASVITGNDIKDARRTKDGYGAPIIGFSLKSDGGRKFEKYTAANIGKELAVILDKRVLIAPMINEVIPAHSSATITGTYTREYVDDMVLMLRSGALPASIKYLQEQTIGPSLGMDSIRKGIYASMAGLIVVMLFMLVYYKAAGINSNLALILNIVILLGILSYFKAALTLPGIAGIILTIGMAVDANVLIFERIKEDLRAGKAPKSSIDSGFKKAFVTILDANVTTFIAAVFLYQFGTGPIQGFAVTLMIGITASMFTAIFVSRVIFDLVYSRKKSLKKISI
jgi:preprotein translocase subunit SecD